jgi:hypothetical protein
MNLLSRLLALQEITKGKKYIRPGQQPPKGVTIHTGKRGGKYYLTEDKHMRLSGQHHELVRGVGVKRDVWDDIKNQFLTEGAKSVEFINKPDNYKDKEGNPLYNIYVNWGEDTQKKIEEKLLRDREKYGKRHESVTKIQEQIDALKKLAEDRLNESSDWWKQKHPDPEEYLEPDEKQKLKELETTGPKEPEPEFKQAFDDLNNGTQYVRISDLRRKLGWSPEKFDQTLEKLWEDSKIQMHEGITTDMDETDVKDSYTDSNGFLHVNLSWNEPVSSDPIKNPDGWTQYPDGRFEIDCTDRDGNREGIYTVEPVGKYSAAISFTPIDGQKIRLTIKKERQNRREENIKRARDLVNSNKKYGLQSFLNDLERQKQDDENITEPKQRTDVYSWPNTLDLKFENADEARAWAANNLKTVVTGIEENANMGHAANLLAWTKNFEDTYNMAVPGRIHLGIHSDWGNRALGLYYYASNCMHFRQDQDVPYDIKHKQEVRLYLADKEKSGNMDKIPYTASDNIDGCYWHELGHMLDHLTKNGLSNVIAGLSQDEKKQIRQLSDYPASKKDPRVKNAEYVAESVSALMTNERTEHVPDTVKSAIEKAFKDMPTLKIDFNVPDPVNVKDWTDAEGEFYNQVKLPEHPKDLSDEDLKTYYTGMNPDDLFSVLKHAKAALKSKKLNPDEKAKDSTREERYRVRQNIERVAKIAGDIHWTHTQTDPGWNKVTGTHENVWTTNPDGYEQTPYYQYDNRNTGYGVEPLDKRVYTRNGNLELRPAGAMGVALFHVDDDGNETLLVDHRANPTAIGAVNTDAARKKYADNIKYQIYQVERKREYDSLAKKYKDREETKKKRQEEAKQKKINAPKVTTDTNTDSGPNAAMHKDTVAFLSRHIGQTVTTRPSEMTPEQKENIINTAVSGYLNVGTQETGLMLDLVNLSMAMAKPAETRSEKNLKKKYKDQYDEGKAASDIISEIHKRYMKKIMETYDTDNPELATYMNNERDSFFRRNKLTSTIPSKLNPEELLDSVAISGIRTYHNSKKIASELTKELESSTSPERQRRIAEVLKEHKLVLQAVRDRATDNILKERMDGKYYSAPPKQIEDIVGANQYSVLMTPIEYDKWESLIRSKSDDEIKNIVTGLQKLLYHDEWIKEAKITKYDWKTNHEANVHSIIRNIKSIRENPT